MLPDSIISKKTKKKKNDIYTYTYTLKLYITWYQDKKTALNTLSVISILTGQIQYFSKRPKQVLLFSILLPPLGVWR